MYSYQFISGLLTPENKDESVEYPWQFLLAGAIAAGGIALRLVLIQYDYARQTMGHSSQPEINRHYWDPETIRSFLQEKFNLTVNFHGQPIAVREESSIK